MRREEGGGREGRKREKSTKSNQERSEVRVICEKNRKRKHLSKSMEAEKGGRRERKSEEEIIWFFFSFLFFFFFFFFFSFLLLSFSLVPESKSNSHFAQVNLHS